MPLIDVLIPVRNGSRYLREALDSLAAQTFRDFRVLICDDGSEDNTWEMLSREQRFPLVAVRNDDALGVTRTLNRLLDLPTEAPYLARFDADDVCQPERFARQFEFMEAHPDIGVVGSWLEAIAEDGRHSGEVKFPLDHAAIKWELLHCSALAHPSVFLRRRILENPRRRYDPSFRQAQDYALWCDLVHTTRLANLPSPLVRYRQHSAAVSVASAEAQRSNARRIQQNYLASLNLPPASRALLDRMLANAATDTPVRAEEARTLLRDLRHRCGIPGRIPGRPHRPEELESRLFVRMSRQEKARWAAAEPQIAFRYLRRLLQPRAASQHRCEVADEVAGSTAPRP